MAISTQRREAEALAAAAQQPSADAAAELPRRRRSRALDAFFKSWSARLALGFLALVILSAILAPLIATHDPQAQSLSDSLSSPSREYLLGTDQVGRDTFSRLLFGSRVTLLAAAESVGIALVLGVPFGLIAGYTGRRIDAAISTISDAIMSLPPLILALALVGILGPGLTNAMIAIGIVFAPRFFRVARGAARSIAHEPYIEASRAAGCTRRRIMWRHVLPNASGPLLVQVSFAVGLAVTAEASLSFLGLGVQDGMPSWGSMIRTAFDSVNSSTFGIFPPSIFITLTILAFSVVGDALRDAFGREGASR